MVKALRHEKESTHMLHDQGQRTCIVEALRHDKESTDMLHDQVQRTCIVEGSMKNPWRVCMSSVALCNHTERDR